jgi:glycogen operon protein
MRPACFPPLSPLVTAEGTLFRVVSRPAQRLFLQLYADPHDPEPERTLPLDPGEHRRGDLWEVFVPGAGAGTLYTWALDWERPLLDPCALAVTGPERFGSDDPHRARPPLPRVNRDATFKSVVVAPRPPRRWERPKTPWSEAVVYELHVRGFTRHASSRSVRPGTYRGLTERIPYLRELGVNAVELLPVHEFDETEVRRGVNLFNYWGYSPIAWLAPNRRYAADAASLEGPVHEFRAMVRAFHEAGIRVLVDVVFNHTGELDAEGPTWNLRALDDERYYLHDPLTREYRNLTGCGNTVRAGHPTTRALILHALRWWVHGLGVDGFRFDLATILSRDDGGAFVPVPPLIRAIEQDRWLSDAILIAEPWDPGGGYQVADWPGGSRWSVWNDRFRDDVRRAWLRDPHGGRALATRLSGSADLHGAGPLRSLNFVTAHDGFTLRDTVSYSSRHNEANGEGGRDGNPHEISAHHGAEGASEDPEVRRARDRARRNLVATLLLAQGVPMLTAGDEFGRTQRGNNNAYCHDSTLTWIDWRDRESDLEFHRFVCGLLRLRRSSAALRRSRYLIGGASDADGAPDVSWFGTGGGPVDWDHRPGLFGYRLSGAAIHTGADADEPDLVVLVNLRSESASFVLPPDREGKHAWTLVVDTAAAPPADFHEPDSAPAWRERSFRVDARSLVVLRQASPV